jgi:hypothetical protein
MRRLFNGVNTGRFVKDGINDYVVHGCEDAVNPGAGRHQGLSALSAQDPAGKENRHSPAPF